MKNHSFSKNVVLCVLLCLASVAGQAQDVTVVGKVFFASDSTAVAGATVLLRDSKGTTLVGTTTGTDGAFEVRAEAHRVADLHIRFVGASPATVQFKGVEQTKIDLGRIYLNSDDQTLEEVVVHGDLKRIDREIVFPESQLVKGSPDALTLLSNLGLSGLSVNLATRTASIRDKEIYWMIDGVPTTLHEVLQVDPKKILRIEYSDLPSIRLLDRGQGGYVNLILKERTDGGSVYAFMNSALLTGFANAEMNGNYHRGKSDFTIGYSGDYRDYPKWKQDMTQTFRTPQGEILREELGQDKSPMAYNSHRIHFTYAYRPSERNLFSITWRNEFGFNRLDKRSNVRETGKESYTRSSVQTYRGYIPTLDAYYKHRFEDGATLESNLVGSVTMGKNDRDLTDRVGEKVMATVSNPIENRYYSLLGEVNYAKQLLPKLNLSVGLQNTYGQTANLYRSVNYTDRMDRNNSYLYAQVSGQLTASLQYNLGTGMKVLYTADKENHRTFVKNQSSMAFYWSPAKAWSVALNSYVTPYLPALSQLSTVTQRYDALTRYAGNPDLKPGIALNNRLTTSYRRHKFNADLSFIYNHTLNPIFNNVLYDKAQHDFVYRPENGINNRMAGADLKMAWTKLFDFMTLIAHGGYSHYDTNVGNQLHKLQDFYWDISLQLYYKDFTFAGYYLDSKASLSGLTVSRPGPASGLAVLWSRDRLEAYAQVYYVGLPSGDEYTQEYLSDTAPYSSHIVIPNNGNMFTAGLVWKFSFGKKKSNIDRRLHNYDADDSMVKVQDK